MHTLTPRRAIDVRLPAKTSLKAALVATRAGLLAASAECGGFTFLGVDCFGPPAHQPARHPWLTIAQDHGLGIRGFDGGDLVLRLHALPPEWGRLPLIYGAGFDHRPELLERLSQRHYLLGNTPDTLALLCDPVSAQAIAHHLRFDFATVRTTPPKDPAGWHRLEAGDEYGERARLAAAAEDEDCHCQYFQAALPGRSLAAFFLADGRQARLLGFSEYLQHNLAVIGAISPARVPAAVRDDINALAQRLTREFGLVGWNRVNFTLAGSRWSVSSITPRPTDEMPLFDALLPEGALAGHIEAVEGRLPERLIESDQVRGMRRVIAPRLIRVARGVLPEWVKDLPAAGREVARGETLCTVFAEGDGYDRGHDQVRATLTHRARQRVRADTPSML